MNKLFLILTILMSACSTTSKQHDNENRVAVALDEKSENILQNLNKQHLKKDNLQILLVAYKDLDSLEIYAKNSANESFKKIQSYPICARSGVLGPKKKEGDKQVPEGFYHIDRFNPKSLFYLSLGINYPNELDKALGYTGSDIFIHGKCETVGCLPMTDELIKEIYVYATWAKEAGQNQIPVYIFPFKMTAQNMEKYRSQVPESTFAFWENIQKGYALFDNENKAVNISVKENKYQFNP